MFKNFKNKIFFTIIFIIFFCFKLSAENKVVYIDLNYLIQNSLAGKSLDSQLKKIQEKNITTFEKTAKKLKSDESKILKQQNVISEKEFQKLVKILSNDVNKYKKDKNISIKNMKKKTAESKILFMSVLQPILAEYSQKKEISLIVQKKNILLGRNDLDITKDILKLLDNNKKKINLK